MTTAKNSTTDVSAEVARASQWFAEKPEWESALSELMQAMPMSLAIREVHRMVKFVDILSRWDGPLETVLDVGCGDGSWWQSLKRKPGKLYGIDISSSVIADAKGRIDHTALVDISSPKVINELKLRSWPGTFDLVIGNCSLEHVENINGALTNISQLLSPSGTFVLFVPTPDWAMRGNMLAFLKRYAPRLAMTFSGAANGFFQHWHLMDAKTWKILLEGNGFKVEEVSIIGGRKTEWLFRFGLPFSFFSFLFKSVCGFYPVRFFSKNFVSKLTNKTFQIINEDLLASVKGEHHDEYAIEYAIRCVKR